MKLESTLRPRRGLMHITSLLDVIFLLLLFFLLASNAAVRSGVAVTLPKSRSALQAAANADIITLSGGNSPQIIFNDKLVTFAQLGDELAKGSGAGGRRQLVLLADEMAAYGRVMKISNLVVDNGYSLILATRPEFEE